MDKKWWEYYEPYLIERLEKEYPDYKSLERPTLDIRWRIDDWSLEKAIEDGTHKEKTYTEEEFKEMARRQNLYYKKYGNWRMPDDWNGE